MSKLIARAFALTKTDIMIWREWKEQLLAERYLEIAEDKTGFEEKRPVSAGDFIKSLDALTLQEKLPTVAEWLEAYEAFMRNDPEQGSIICTYEGDPVRINCEFKPGAMPFLSAKIYVPKMTCSPLAWFAHGINSRADFGWRAVLIPQAREDVLRRHVIKDDIAPVGALKVHGKSASGRCILVSVAQW